MPGKTNAEIECHCRVTSGKTSMRTAQRMESGANPREPNRTYRHRSLQAQSLRTNDFTSSKTR
jgi:hypothetical protein